MRPGDRDQCENKYAIADIAKEIAEPEADRDQSPEDGVAPALWIGGVARAADRKAAKGRAGERVNPVNVDHASGPPLSRGRHAKARSSNSNRAPWIRNAQIALGIAQTDSSNGVSWMPKPASAPWISRIEEMARKMSSPKNRPTLSVAADMALTRSA